MKDNNFERIGNLIRENGGEELFVDPPDDLFDRISTEIQVELGLEDPEATAHKTDQDTPSN